MKKRLLLGFAALCTAFSSYALEQGEFVYTPQGRFQITGANVASSNFSDFTGWTVVTAAEKTLADLFNINGNGYAEGLNSVQSLDATVGEGMYFKFEPSDAGAAYVVSFKMKGTPQTSVRTRLTVWDGNNPSKEVSVAKVVRVQGNSANTYGATEGEIVVNTAEEMTEEWTTYNYAIVGDGTARTYFISFTGMPTTTEIADLQIAPALQFADLRQRDAMLEKLNAYKNCYAWSDAILAEFAMTETIENLQAIGDESGQADLDEQLTTAQEVLAEFLDKNMDDYLAGNSDNYFGIRSADASNLQKQSKLGDWTCVDRGFWSKNAYPDLGHYQSGNTWANGNPNNAMGVTIQKVLDAGSYVFAIEANAALREADVSKTWTNDDGMKPAYGEAFIVKMVDGVAADTVVVVKQDLDPVKFTPFYCIAQITESGTYELGFKSYCKEAYKAIKFGSVTYVKDASVWAKTENKYSQKELGYEADVREQITTGRNNLTTATENLANAEYLWGKAELQACVDSVETKIAAYEQKTQDDIIATFDADVYNKTNSTKNAEEGLMVFEVYNEAVRDIIAANKKFLAVNDTLASIQVAIDNAEGALDNRLYNAATGKDALQAAINKAKEIQTQMKASQYSEENAATIKAANAELAEAVETFKASVPASAVTAIADIDFSQLATATTITVEETEVTQWVIAGAVNEMVLPNYTEDGTGTTYGQGIFANGERTLADTLRVGNGEAVVNIPAEKQVGGTDILRITFDYYFGNLSGKYAGFALQGEDAVIADFYFSPYDGKASANTFGLNFSTTYMPKVGDSKNSNAAIAVASNKTHFEVIVDYGKKAMYCSTTAAKGSQTTNLVGFDGTKMTKFVVKSDYNNSDRRCWFDNLKIERVAAGETDPFVDGIREVNTVNAKTGAIYNLNGVQVSKASKPGLYIIDGKKVIIK